MAQAIFLKTETTLATSKHDVSASVKSPASSREDIDYKEFSSELNKQIDKQAKSDNPQESQAEQSSDASKSIDVKIAKAEKIISEDGNNLSDEITQEIIELGENETSDHLTPEFGGETDDQQVPELDIEKDEVGDAAEQPVFELEIETKTGEAEVTPIVQNVAVNDEIIKKIPKPLTKSGEQVPVVKVSKQDNAKEKNIPQSIIKGYETNPKQNVEGARLESNKTEQRHQPVPLRSDILHALSNNKAMKKEGKLEIPVAKTQVIASEKSTIKMSSENQEMAKLMEQVKPNLQKHDAVLPSHLSSAAPSPTVTQSTISSASPLTSVGQTQAPIFTMQPAVQSEAWNKVLSNRVTWMASEGIQRAVLRLNPANLGPVEVKLQMQNEQASVTFVAQHAATREALEQALPRLRESMQENDMELVKAEVSQQAFEQEGGEQEDEASDGSSSLQQSANEDLAEEGINITTVEQDDESLGLSLYV